ncbi:MAG: hypothetical protein AB7K24_28730 [Gemmataceae bacterium]
MSNDFEQFGAEIEQQRFNERFNPIRKRAGRENKLFGCFTIFCGLAMMVAGILMTRDQLRKADHDPLEIVRMLGFLVVGGLVTVVTGTFIWRGRSETAAAKGSRHWSTWLLIGGLCVLGVGAVIMGLLATESRWFWLAGGGFSFASAFILFMGGDWFW